VPRVKPVYAPEHVHQCPHCKSAWAHEGHANLCGLKSLACILCSQPAAVRARGLREMALRDRERESGFENVFPFFATIGRLCVPHEPSPFPAEEEDTL
jgi:hypothetical protein